jgi:hypothetical protein
MMLHEFDAVARHDLLCRHGCFFRVTGFSFNYRSVFWKSEFSLSIRTVAYG